MDRTQLEAHIERSLEPGHFISWRATSEFIEDLERAAGLLEQLVKDGRAGLASNLYEIFIAACHEKAGEVDDSGGNLGHFVAGLFAGLVRARSASGADSGETADFLLTWMEDDPYGFCMDLERDLPGKMNAELLEVFLRKVRERLDASPPDDRSEKGAPRRRWTKVLKHILTVRGDVDAYVALCGPEGPGPSDCDVIAGILERKKKLEDALGWVDRGLSAGHPRGADSRYELGDRRRRLLLKLGRTGEAIDHSWSRYRDYPSVFSYRELMELVPSEERSAWHGRAMAASEKAPLGSVVELLRETAERDRLAARIDRASDEEIRQVSFRAMIDAAESLATSHPSAAARVYAQLGLHILAERNARLYRTALRYFARARDLSTAAGARDAWERLASEIRGTHRRKKGFMEGFERIARGGPVEEPQPSLIERAKKKWPAPNPDPGPRSRS